MRTRHNADMNAVTVEPETEMALGESFDDYLEDFEAKLSPQGKVLQALLAAQYDLASQALSLRKAGKLTQSQLAERAGVNQSDISRLERGNANLTLASLNRISRVLGMRVGFVPLARASRLTSARAASS
jgi:DNA-binding XRE family transcriptional regulator